MAAIKNRLREFRERINLTQFEVGKVLDITSSAVSMHESGDRGLSDELIRKYAALYKVETYELFFDPDTQFVPTESPVESVA